jgi:hypothetical protein
MENVRSTKVAHETPWGVTNFMSSQYQILNFGKLIRIDRPAD